MSEVRIDIKQGDAELVEIMGYLVQQRPWLQDDINRLARNCEHGIRLEISPLKSNRSHEQQAYYRKHCREFARFCGLHPDEMHDEMLMLCFGSQTVSTRMGPRTRPLKRSEDVSKEEYSQLIDTLISTAANFGFVIPPAATRREAGGSR